MWIHRRSSSLLNAPCWLKCCSLCSKEALLPDKVPSLVRRNDDLPDTVKLFDTTSFVSDKPVFLLVEPCVEPPPVFDSAFLSLLLSKSLSALGRSVSKLCQKRGWLSGGRSVAKP